MHKKHSGDTTASKGNDLVKTTVFGISITNEKKNTILKYVTDSIEKTSEKYFIVTPNPEMVVYASRHAEFKNILNSAGIALCDGMQLFRAARFLGKPVQERITGVSFMDSLCNAVSEKPITVGFLGGRDGVAELTGECLARRYPGLKVRFISEEWDQNAKLIRNSQFVIRNSIDILFVAFGSPKQEEWMAKNISKLNIRVMMGVGGAFNEIAGREKSPPAWIDRSGFKWLWRLCHEPWRWKRQLALLNFVGMVLKAKIRRIYTF